MTTTSQAAPLPSLSDDWRYSELLRAARGMVRCDAAALLRLDGEALLPVAVDGLSEDTLGRRFPVQAHPRLARLLASTGSLRFAADCGLPDPYDGLVDGQPAILPVHDCMGAPLRVHGRPWGLVTLDALQPGSFDAVTPGQLAALVALLQSGIEAAETIRVLTDQAARERDLARVLQAGDRGRRELLGKSAPMQQLRHEIDTVAASDLTVLILGETGVGKELVAQRLHALSPRREQALIQVNCAALPETLADSELFGHHKGAFTGATQERSGKFQLADRGTLFLDEVGELPLAVQAKLLRALQSGELQRPGSDRLLHVDVRVIAATNRDLAAEVAAGRFRADLYHRLSVYPLRVPPLRERGRDVLALAGGFLEENQHRLGARNLRLSPDAKQALLNQPWPGNVRELEHLVARAALRAVAEQGRDARWVGIEPRHLLLAPEAGRPAAAAPGPQGDAWPGGTLKEATAAFQRQWLAALLARHPGSLAAAAREAGMDRSNFHRLVRRLGLLPADAGHRSQT
ncbi:nitric oxide reductase transcriptional regulator NorR [Eleftheria terrae]|uniref:nitric oxide reductase transcriptional regulator NorR n=1 Tax=Eleftheria terrae TaxID=1597781 RepID=UPI00263B3A31|nr:nitric oxide reductase transcriptional regulator NorR [Eleftheria terrae]WKB53097.1 nitric oxide reductase transcriptional regulator NorR [Eleftheria terrae]